MGIRYQTGALERRKTALGLCWFMRFRGPNGDRPRFRVGLVSEMNKTQARKAAEPIRQRFNSPDGFEPETPPAALFKDVIDHYERERMPERYSTSQSYKSMLKVHIRPTWGETPAKDVRSAAVEAWLLDLKLAPKTRGHIKGLMSVLFRFAMHHEYIPAAENPMRLFPMATARKKEPRILTRKEFKVLVEKMPVGIFRTMVIVCGCLGLHASEVAGLRWEDIDWLKREIHIRNGVVHGRIGDVKTKASRRKLPLSPSLFRELEARRKYSEFKEFDDFIFASPYSAGEKPYDPGEVRKKYIDAAATAACLGEGIGWHTLRHSYRRWIGEKDHPLELQRDLMRHSHMSTTMDFYGGSSFPEKLREASEELVEDLLQ